MISGPPARRLGLRLVAAVLVGLGITVAGCSIRTEHPVVLPDNPVLRRPVVIELNSQSTAETYRFRSWLSFPAVGPWTYDISGDFDRYAAAFDRQALSNRGDTTQPALRLRLTLVGYDLNTFYRGSCSIRATLTDPASAKILLDRNYVGTGRTAFQRVLWGGWFFGVGTRSAVQATMDGAFTSAFGKIATDVSKASEESEVNQRTGGMRSDARRSPVARRITLNVLRFGGDALEQVYRSRALHEARN